MINAETARPAPEADRDKGAYEADGHPHINTAALSVITASKPGRLSKQFTLAADGALTKFNGGELARGEYRRVTVAGPQDLADLLHSLTPAQALVYGVAAVEQSSIASRKAKQDGDITRTRDCFDWPSGCGVLMLDYDPRPGVAPLTMPDLFETLREAWPEIETAPVVMASSGSAHVFHGETELKGAGGLRLFVFVADARDIPRAGAVLFRRLWLAGHGFYMVSRSGALLERGLIDANVWQPERLDFAAGAACVPPLEQRRPAPVVLNRAAAPVDTAATLPELTADDLQRLAELHADARAEVAEEQGHMRELWIAERVERWEQTAGLEKLPDEEREQQRNDARERFRRAVTDGRLFGDFTLLHQSGQSVTVGDLLDDSDRWHGERFADPLEPDYSNDCRICWANLKSGGKPFLYSHAHGGQRFTLVRASATLKTAAGEVPRLITEADALMSHAGEVYQRGGELVRIIDGGLLPVSGPWLRTHLETIASFERFDLKRRQWVPTDCPGELHARTLHNRGAWSVPELSGVVRAPILRPDGTLLTRPGYDKPTGVLLLADHPDAWPPVPEHPTPEQVRAAVAALWEPFAHFPYVSPLDRALNLSACFTAVQRIMLPTAPAFAWSAYKAGSGKGKNAKAVAWLGGSEPVESPWSTEAEEQRKRIMAKLLAAPSSLLIDNVNGPLESDTLCAVLTSTTYEDRRLGASDNVSVPTRLLVLATGNNIRVVGDLARRVLVSTIDHGVESPEALSFPFDPVARVRERWLYYRAAVLVILRGFIAAGRPRGGAGTIGSFEEWDSLIRQAVCWLRDFELAPFELADPADAVAANYAEDPETAKLRALLAAWYARFDGQVIRVGELIKAADRGAHMDERGHIHADENCELLAEVLEEIAGDGRDINSRRLGRWIERQRGRIVEGLRIEAAGNRSGQRLWRVRAG